MGWSKGPCRVHMAWCEVRPSSWQQLRGFMLKIGGSFDSATNSSAIITEPCAWSPSGSCHQVLGSGLLVLARSGGSPTSHGQDECLRVRRQLLF